MTRKQQLLVALVGAIVPTWTLGLLPIGPAPANAATQDKADAAKAEAQRHATKNLMHLALAMHEYHDAHGTFPPSALVSKDGKALLSWRVLLLPHLDGAALFQEFKLAEPWDSAHNIKLLAKMPKVFTPTWGDKKEPGMTPWQVFHGPGAGFEGTKGLRIPDFQDGTSNTILVVEGGQMVPWTKPADLLYDRKKDVPAVGCLFPDIFHYAMADGSAHVGARKCDVESLRCAIERNDGKAFDPGKLAVPAK
jgi:Protein of unknown function (DUF1559)